MASTPHFEKMHKLPEPWRFFDLNALWYFPNRWVVRVLYPLPISANQITLLALMAGLAAAGFYAFGGERAFIFGAVFLYGNLFLDNVDGPLARLRGEVSRLGRFLDSFADFTVAVAVYGAITWRLAQSSPNPVFLWALGILALLSGLLQCSYWVFYYVHYASRVGAYENNRTDETVTEQDRQAAVAGELPGLVLFLQKFHNAAYGWQDQAVAMFDGLSRKLAGGAGAPEQPDRWYADKTFLVWMGPLCVCSNTMALIVFSLIGQLELFLYLVVLLGNGYLIGLQVWKIARYKSAVGH